MLLRMGNGGVTLSISPMQRKNENRRSKAHEKKITAVRVALAVVERIPHISPTRSLPQYVYREEMSKID